MGTSLDTVSSNPDVSGQWERRWAPCRKIPMTSISKLPHSPEKHDLHAYIQ